MPTFTIDTENNITAFATAAHAPEDHERFATENELAKTSAQWPLNRFVDTWNGFAGVVPFDDLKPVKKFTDRKTAVSRIWKAIQVLTPTPAPAAGVEAPPKDADAAPREGSKQAIVLEMVRRQDGATLSDIMAATGWQAHSVRGFISGSLSKKMGIKVESFKAENGARTYRAGK